MPVKGPNRSKAEISVLVRWSDVRDEHGGLYDIFCEPVRMGKLVGEDLDVALWEHFSLKRTHEYRRVTDMSLVFGLEILEWIQDEARKHCHILQFILSLTDGIDQIQRYAAGRTVPDAIIGLYDGGRILDRDQLFLVCFLPAHFRPPFFISENRFQFGRR